MKTRHPKAIPNRDEKKRKPTRSRVQLGDNMRVKECWATDLLNALKLDTVICGRAGFEWDIEQRPRRR